MSSVSDEGFHLVRAQDLESSTTRSSCSQAVSEEELARESQSVDLACTDSSMAKDAVQAWIDRLSPATALWPVDSLVAVGVLEEVANISVMPSSIIATTESVSMEKIPVSDQLHPTDFHCMCQHLVKRLRQMARTHSAIILLCATMSSVILLCLTSLTPLSVRAVNEACTAVMVRPTTNLIPINNRNSSLTSINFNRTTLSIDQSTRRKKSQSDLSTFVRFTMWKKSIVKPISVLHGLSLYSHGNLQIAKRPSTALATIPPVMSRLKTLRNSRSNYLKKRNEQIHTKSTISNDKTVDRGNNKYSLNDWPTAVFLGIQQALNPNPVFSYYIDTFNFIFRYIQLHYGQRFITYSHFSQLSTKMWIHFRMLRRYLDNVSTGIKYQVKRYTNRLRPKVEQVKGIISKWWQSLSTSKISLTTQLEIVCTGDSLSCEGLNSSAN